MPLTICVELHPSIVWGYCHQDMLDKLAEKHPSLNIRRVVYCNKQSAILADPPLDFVGWAYEILTDNFVKGLQHDQKD